MIESMYLKVTRNETVQNFNVWVYGDKELVRGSGLFVGENGIATNHHFLLPKDGSAFRFGSGEYKIELFAKILGQKHGQRIWMEIVNVEASLSRDMEEKDAGLYFDWGPDSQRYIAHVDRRSENPSEILERLLEPPVRSDSSAISS